MNKNFDTSVIKLPKYIKITDEENMKKILQEVYDALLEKGYNPLQQIAQYLITGDPTYITSHKGARVKICKIDRFVLLETMMAKYVTTL